MKDYLYFEFEIYYCFEVLKLLAEAEHTDKPVLMVFAVKNMLILEVVVLSQDVRFIANYLFF